MFGIDSSEFLLIAVVALIVIGPKDLPRVMRLVGGWVGRGRAMTRHLRSGFDTMMREAELEEMQKMWAKQNADIMAATPAAAVGEHAYDTGEGHDAAVGAHVYDHPGGIVADTSTSDCHPRESGDPSPDELQEMGPRVRGDDNLEEAAVHAMTGPQPSAHALADADEPPLPLAHPTAQP